MSTSGRQSVVGASKTLQRLPSSSPQFDDDIPVSERCRISKQSVAKAADSARPASGHTQQSAFVNRPPSACGQRAPSARGQRRRAIRRNIGDSYVDESLFGPAAESTFTTPWQPKQQPVKPFIFDCTDYKAKAKANSTNSTANVPSSRPSSQRSARSRPRSARLNSQPSFVDESLFGDQLETSTWRAPWDKKDCRPKPFTFDATNYRKKEQQNQSNSDSRLQSAKRTPPWR